MQNERGELLARLYLADEIVKLRRALASRSLDIPGDEEIQTEATVRAIAAACSTDEEIDADMEFGFILGAKWLRSRIGGGR
jgi:hypothetical protein